MATTRGTKKNQVVDADYVENFVDLQREFFRAFDQLVDQSVLAINLSTPPETPDGDDAYFIPKNETATDDWADKEGYVAVWRDNVRSGVENDTGDPYWEFYLPKNGDLIYNDDDSETYRVDSSDVGLSLFGGGSPSETIYKKLSEQTESTADTFDLDSYAKATYRSASYDVEVIQGSVYEHRTMIITHNGTTAYLTETGNVGNGDSTITFDAVISGDDVILQWTNLIATATTVRAIRTNLFPIVW